MIGKGSYGCVYKPPLICNKKKTSKYYNSKITKLTTRLNGINEIKRQKMVDNVDPQFKYHLPPPTICTPSLDPKQIDLIKSCRLLVDDMGELLPQNEISLLTIQNGGLDLDKFVNYLILTKDTTKKLTNEDYHKPSVLSLNTTYLLQINELEHKIKMITDFWKKSIVLIEALSDFIKKKIIHTDLRPANIVYDRVDQRFNIIDFGLATTFSNYNKQDVHFSYPPETYLLNPNVYNFITQLSNVEFKNELGIEPFNPYKSFMDSYITFIEDIVPLSNRAINISNNTLTIKQSDNKHLSSPVLDYNFLNKEEIFKLFDVNIYKNHTIKEIKYNTMITHDIYGMGYSLLYVLLQTYKLLEINDKPIKIKYQGKLLIYNRNKLFIEKMYKLLFSMVHPNCFKRPTIDILKKKYNHIINILHITPLISKTLKTQTQRQRQTTKTLKTQRQTQTQRQRQTQRQTQTQRQRQTTKTNDKDKDKHKHKHKDKEIKKHE